MLPLNLANQCYRRGAKKVSTWLFCPESPLGRQAFFPRLLSSSVPQTGLREQKGDFFLRSFHSLLVTGENTGPSRHAYNTATDCLRMVSSLMCLIVHQVKCMTRRFLWPHSRIPDEPSWLHLLTRVVQLFPEGDSHWAMRWLRTVSLLDVWWTTNIAVPGLGASSSTKLLPSLHLDNLFTVLSFLFIVTSVHTFTF